MVVVGVGLNIAPLPAAPAAAPPLTHGHACLQEISPAATPPSALHRVALPLVRALQQFEREGFAGFASAYARRVERWLAGGPGAGELRVGTHRPPSASGRFSLTPSV